MVIDDVLISTYCLYWFYFVIFGLIISFGYAVIDKFIHWGNKS